MFIPIPIHGDFICPDCGRRTDILPWHIEPHGEAMYGVCKCGGTFDNAVECTCCGEIIPESLAEKDEDGNYVCEGCYKELTAAYALATA